MDTALESRYREGLARLVFAACLLLFATCLGVLFLGLAALGPPGLFGGLLFITSFAFTLVVREQSGCEPRAGLLRDGRGPEDGPWPSRIVDIVRFQ
jgi:hypothetical protein